MVDQRDSGNLFVVTNDMAHAWTEVLLLPEANLWSEVDSVPNQQDLVQDAKEANILSTSKVIGYNNEQSNTIKNNSLNLENKMKFGFQAIISVLHMLVPIVSIFGTVGFIAFKIIYYNINRKITLGSLSNIPIYKYMKKRLNTILSDRYLEIDEYLWLNGIEEEDIKLMTEVVINSAYSEFFVKKSPVNLDKEKYYYKLERYIKDRQNLLSYLVNKYFSQNKL